MTLRLNGDNTGFTEIKAPNDAGDNSITLPTSNGGANQLLQNGGTAGALQYTSAGDGLHYDSTGRLLVGTDTAPAGTDAQYTKLAIRGNTLNTNACYLSLGNRKTTTDTTSNDNLGIITFNDNDSDAGEYARIVGSASGANAVNDYPGKLTFSTTGDGSSAPTSRIEINQTGALKLLAGCPGIDFSGIQSAAINGAAMTSETLSAYETGTWTPKLGKFGTTGEVLATNRYGYYKRVGDLLFLSFYFYNAGVLSTGQGSFGTGSNVWYISNLPFTLSSGTSSAYTSIAANYQQINGKNYNLLPGFNGGAYSRWQANTNSALQLYSEIGNENWTSGNIEMSGSGVLCL